MVATKRSCKTHGGRRCQLMILVTSPEIRVSSWGTASRQGAAAIMKRHQPPVELDDDDDDEDEFKPLFDYSDTVPPAPEFLSSDDSDGDIAVIKSALPSHKLETTPAKIPPTPTSQKDQAQKAKLDEDDDDDDDDSWLMPSPSKLPKLTLPTFSAGNYALQQLRSKRMELMMLQQNASPEAIRRFEEAARAQAQQRAEPEPPMVVKTPEILNCHEELAGSGSAASEEKEKILLKVQNNAGSFQSIRIFKTDKFEKLFRVYAGMVKLPLENMVFRFDGDQISPNSTAKEQDMEDGDIVEVYIRS